MKPLAQSMSLWFCISSAERLDLFGRRSSSHTDDQAAAHQRIGKEAETCQCDGAERGRLLGSHSLAVHDAAADHSTAAMSRIEEGTYLLGGLALAAEQRVHLVVEDG